MKKLALFFTCLVLFCGSGFAEEAANEVDRNGDQLRDVLRHPDVDSTDTLIVASNASSRRARVVCTAFDANGNRVGRAATVVPPRGLRFIRAADISNGVDYVGRAQCVTGNAGVAPAAFLLSGPAITDLPVQSRIVNGNVHFRVPVTASF